MNLGLKGESVIITGAKAKYEDGASTLGIRWRRAPTSAMARSGKDVWRKKAGGAGAQRFVHRNLTPSRCVSTMPSSRGKDDEYRTDACHTVQQS